MIWCLLRKLGKGIKFHNVLNNLKKDMQHYKGAFYHCKCSWLITYVYVQLQKEIVKLMLSHSESLCFVILTTFNIFLAYYLSLCGLKFSGICTKRIGKCTNIKSGVIFSH